MTGRINKSANGHQVVYFLAYHKTASKWMWSNFFTPHYPNHQTDILATPVAELRKIVDEDKAASPFIVRQRVENGTMGGDLPGLAEALAAAYPEAKVVVSIRSQRSILPSHYGQYVTNGGRLGFERYLAEAVHINWHYYPMIRSLQERFGDRLLVYLFEDFRNDPYATLCKLLEFIGEPAGGLRDKEIRDLAALPPVNPQRNDLMIDVMLMLNRLRMRLGKNAVIPQISRPGHDHIVVEMTELIGRRYRRAFGKTLRYRKFNDDRLLDRVYGEENAALAKLLNRPLREFGYPI